MKNILLLTSTIQPNPNQPQLKLADPAERLQDYANALLFQNQLLEKGVIDKIVYVDNSGYDLGELKERFPSKDIEWVSFYGLDYDSSFHRGYGEFRLIDYAFATSTVLRGMKETDRVWKLTGRYVVENLRRIIEFTPNSFDLYCDIHKGWAEMGFMAWSPLGYEVHIRELWRSFASDNVPELILAQRIAATRNKKCKILTKYWWPPFIIGRRGFDGSNFQGKLTPIKFKLITCAKIIALPFRQMKAYL